MHFIAALGYRTVVTERQTFTLAYGIEDHIAYYSPNVYLVKDHSRYRGMIEPCR